MSADVLPWAAITISTLSLLVNARWSRRADRRAEHTEAMAARGAAVSDLVDGLHRIRQLARQADVEPVTQRQVVEVMIDFEDLSHRHEGALPPHLRAVDREVRAAMGNAFGPPAWAGLDVRLANHDLATFDHYWWDVTLTYLDHVHVCLQDWRTAPRRRRPTELVPFYAWRRNEDAAYFAPA